MSNFHVGKKVINTLAMPVMRYAESRERLLLSCCVCFGVLRTYVVAFNVQVHFVVRLTLSTCIEPYATCFYCGTHISVFLPRPRALNHVSSVFFLLQLHHSSLQCIWLLYGINSLTRAMYY